nr:MAG TPA: hypothetical protein [Caudoviricetes sp.]
MYETINTFRIVIFFLFCSYYYFSQGCSGRLGWSWEYFCLRIIFQVYTLYEEVLIQLSFNVSSHCFRFVFIKPIG